MKRAQHFLLNVVLSLIEMTSWKWEEWEEKQEKNA